MSTDKNVREFMKADNLYIKKRLREQTHVQNKENFVKACRHKFSVPLRKHTYPASLDILWILTGSNVRDICERIQNPI